MIAKRKERNPKRIDYTRKSIEDLENLSKNILLNYLLAAVQNLLERI
jgi:hypothetical protein